MSDYSITIVPRKSEVENKDQKIKKVIDWLIDIDAIKKAKSECVLGLNGLGYAISKGAGKVVTEPGYLPFQLAVNGLEIETERRIFTTVQNGLDSMTCPSCKDDIAGENWSFFDNWFSKESNNLTCPKCGQVKEIHAYKFAPVWGFSDLGFTFWNWGTFKIEFIREFEIILGMEVDVVYAHV